MKKSGWDVICISLPEYEKLVVEIYFDATLLMTLDREDSSGEASIAMFCDDGSTVRVSLAELDQILQVARREL